ncbi:MAG: ATP-dependent metallopeptidase FtsH/Yme1/Tma family protein, partial [Alistipes sp.]|nr:ATP-dependent metallopeptidase FtsH/Yme1/Tma family protein [Alistipes sp.]
MANNREKISRFRPNIMWFWGAVMIAIVGYWIFSDNESAPVKSNWKSVKQLVEAGEVNKILVVNHEEARVVLNEAYADSLRANDLLYKSMPKSDYQLYFNIGSLDKFESDFDAANKQGGEVASLENEKEKPWY